MTNITGDPAYMRGGPAATCRNDPLDATRSGMRPPGITTEANDHSQREQPLEAARKRGPVDQPGSVAGAGR
jgi:hypothetical protein